MKSTSDPEHKCHVNDRADSSSNLSSESPLASRWSCLYKKSQRQLLGFLDRDALGSPPGWISLCWLDRRFVVGQSPAQQIVSMNISAV